MRLQNTSDAGQICLSYEDVTWGKFGGLKIAKVRYHLNPVEKRRIVIYLKNIFSEEKFNLDTPFRNHFELIVVIFNLFSKIKPKFWKWGKAG